MKYLILPNAAKPMGECPYDTSGCPNLCIMHCPVQVTNCLQPLGPGFSPTDGGDDIDDK